MGLCLYMSPDSLYENNIFFSGYSQNIHIKVLTSLVLIAVDHRKLWFESWPGPCPDGPLGNFCSSSHHVKWSENHQAWISGKSIKLSLNRSCLFVFKLYVFYYYWAFLLSDTCWMKHKCNILSLIVSVAV